MRIFHAYKAYHPDEYGGVPTVISCLADNRSGRFKHSVLSARSYGWGRRFVHDSIPVTMVGSLGKALSAPLAPGYVPAFINQARHADVVVHHAPFPLNDAAIWLGLPKQTALVVYWHADILAYPRLKAMITPVLKHVLERADKIVVSGAPMIEGSDILRPHAAKCEIISYGVDLDFWRSLDPEERGKVNEIKRRHPRHIVAVGRLIPYKGFGVLVRAMQDVDAHATIIGDGPLNEQLKQLAAKLGLSGRINFPGQLDNAEIKILFHSAQVLAFPSITNAEAFGIVQAEAMATGLPVVNTQLTTSVPLIARHNQEGLTVPVDDPAAFAQALNLILDDASLAQRLGAAAYERATNEFSLHTFRSKMADVYESAVRERQRRLRG